MIFVKELKSVARLVKQILREDEQARNSDGYLYWKVLDTIGKSRGVDVNNISVANFLLHQHANGFPGFETVRRTRQKVQRTHPELAACERVECMRIVREETFREYAKGCLE